MGTDQRTAPRYFLLTPLPATVNTLSADVIDLSAQGARLQVTNRMKRDDRLSFALHARGVSVVTTATVLWCDLAAISLMDDDDSDRYYCGVVFEHPFSVIGQLIEELVEHRAAVPMEEMRHGARYRVNAPLTAFVDGFTSARVLDISAAGIRLGTARLLQAGAVSTFRLRLNGREMPVDIKATVIWSRPAERIGRFEAGLRIDVGEQAMRAAIEELSIRNEIVLEANTLERKFNPLTSHPVPGLLGLLR